MLAHPSLGMRTTYCAYALQDAMASDESFIIRKAIEAGAIILGKANLQV
jgi:Asp-tRNA(Asn)/Glu-tRNA(Gln) amidotransferase A subunit family amidase